MGLIEYTPNTGGDGTPENSLSGLEVRTIYNRQHKALMSGYTFLTEDFVWANSSGSTPSADVTSIANKTVVVTFDYDAGAANINLAAGVEIIFAGGKIFTTGTLVGNNTKIYNDLNKQCFNVSINFAGTWVSVEAAPQWFGAVCSASRTVLAGTAVDSSAAIQKVFDSPFGYKPLKGFYYVPTVINISKPCYVDFGGILNTSFKDWVTSYNPEPNYVCFYTDQNNSIFNIQSHSVTLFNFNIDITQATGYTSKMISYDLNYCIWGAWVRANLIDNKEHCRIGGAIGIGLINKNVQALDSTGVAGYLTDAHFDINTMYVAKPVWIEDRSAITYSATPPVASNCWINDIYVNLKTNGYKEIHLGNLGGNSSHDIFLQSAHTLTLEERDTLYAGYIGRSVLRLQMADLVSASSGGYWYNLLPIKLGEGITLSEDTKARGGYIYNPGVIPIPVSGVTQRSNVAILAQKMNKTNFISELNNYLIGWNQKATVTVKAHSGAAIDFDSLTPTIGSEAETGNIGLFNTGSLFTLKGSATRYLFGASADLDKDFVEIALTGKSISGTNMYISLNGSDGTIKRIQVIGFKSSGNPDIYDNVIPLMGGTERILTIPLLTVTYTSMAIRLIGAYASGAGKDTYINDIALERSSVNEGHNFVPATSYPAYKHEGWLNQTGTDNPALTTFINSYPNPASSTRQSVGTYRFLIGTGFTAGKTIPKEKYTVFLGVNGAGGRVEVEWTHVEFYTILTYNSSGVLSDNILVNFPIFTNTYW